MQTRVGVNQKRWLVGPLWLAACSHAPSPQRAALVALIARDCFDLRDARQRHCTHSGHIFISCVIGSRAAEVYDYCPDDDKAKTGFIDRVRALLHIEARLRDEPGCSVSEVFGRSQTSLTVHPLHITRTTFEPTANANAAPNPKSPRAGCVAPPALTIRPIPPVPAVPRGAP
jgi:hypothetical protein